MEMMMPPPLPPPPPIILVRFSSHFNLSTDFQKNIEISNFMKICLVEAKLFSADKWA